MELPYTFAGLLVGLIVGLTGIGGGALMTPLLVLGFGIPPLAAVGTDLVYAALTKTTGVWVHARRGTVHWRVMTIMAMGSIPAALATVVLLQWLEVDAKTHEKLITVPLSVALILTSLVLLLRERLHRIHEIPSFAGVRAVLRRWRAFLTVLAGVAIGVLITLSSVGAGALGTAALVFLYPSLRGAAIVGTDLAHAVPLATVAGLGHMHMGNVNFALLGSLLLGSLPGVYVGSRLGTFLPDRILRPMLAAMLMLIGLRFVL